MGRPLLWSSDTPSWHRTQTDVFQYHFNYIIYTQHFSFRKTNKKSTPSSYLWKVLFPTVIEIRIPFHPSGKRKKKKKQGPGSPAEKVACGEGPLEKSRGPDHMGCRAAKGFRVRETETEGVCWETEATAQPRSQGEAGGGHRDRGEGQNLASEQKASFEAHESRDLVPWSCPL